MYDDDRLKEIREQFLESMRPDELAELRQTGELEQHLQNKADSCRKHAASLIKSGHAFKEQAWNWAIRVVLLESDYD